MKIALGGDSAGKPLIDVIEAHLKSKPGHEVTNLSQPGFYADLSATIAKAVKAGTYERAILCCGTGNPFSEFGSPIWKWIWRRWRSCIRCSAVCSQAFVRAYAVGKLASGTRVGSQVRIMSRERLGSGSGS